jgi:hypothetical protein
MCRKRWLDAQVGLGDAWPQFGLKQYSGFKLPILAGIFTTVVLKKVSTQISTYPIPGD